MAGNDECRWFNSIPSTETSPEKKGKKGRCGQRKIKEEDILKGIRLSKLKGSTAYLSCK